MVCSYHLSLFVNTGVRTCVHFGQRFQVKPSAKVAPVSVENCHSEAVIVFEVFDSFAELSRGAGVHAVAFLGPVYADCDDFAEFFGQDG